MANGEHLHWLKEGSEFWNKRRRKNEFTPDLFQADLAGFNLDGADLRNANLMNANLTGASLIEADLSSAILHNTILRQAKLQRAKLQRASLELSDLRNADLRGATLRLTSFRRSKTQGANFGTFKTGGLTRAEDEQTLYFADLRQAKDLTQLQLEAAQGDNGTYLSSPLRIPIQWGFISVPEDHPNFLQGDPRNVSRTEFSFDTNNPAFSDETARGPSPELPQPPHGSGVNLGRNNKLSLGHNDIPPTNNALIGLYEDLCEKMDDLRNIGNLDNVAPILGRSLKRFADRTPERFEDLEQIRFGASTAALHLQFKGERPNLEENASAHVGHIAALLHHADLITARLPDWQSFLAEEEETAEVILAREEDSVAILEHASEALRTSPETFDISLFERVREYLDDKTIEGYLASKELLLSIAHKTFTFAGELLTDTATETRKLAIKSVAAGLLASLGAPLLKLAGLLPKQLDWLAKWIEYLPSLLG